MIEEKGRREKIKPFFTIISLEKEYYYNKFTYNKQQLIHTKQLK